MNAEFLMDYSPQGVPFHSLWELGFSPRLCTIRYPAHVSITEDRTNCHRQCASRKGILIRDLLFKSSRFGPIQRIWCFEQGPEDRQSGVTQKRCIISSGCWVTKAYVILTNGFAKASTSLSTVDLSDWKVVQLRSARLKYQHGLIWICFWHRLMD